MAVVKRVTRSATSSEAWLRRLQAGRQELRRMETIWRRNRALLLGQDANTGQQDWVSVNLTWAAFETLIGVCYAQNPEGIVRETRPDLDQVAQLLTASCQQDFEIMRARNYARLAVVDVFWAGFGCTMEYQTSDVVQTPYSFAVKEDKESPEKTYEGSMPTLANQRYGLKRLHPASMIRDPVASSPDFCDHEWVALEYYPTKKQLKETDVYSISKEMLDKLPTLTMAPRLEQPLGADMPVRVMPQMETDENDEYARVRVYEIWDRTSRRVYYMPALSDEIIGDREWPVDLIYNSERLFPWSTLYFNEHPDSQWPIAEITNAAPQLEQFNKMWQYIIRDATHKWRKFLIRGDQIQKGHSTRLVSGPANQVIAVNEQKITDPKSFRLDQVIMPVADVVQKQDTLAVLELCKRMVHELFGTGDFASGGMRNTRSATEAAALADFMKVRMTNRSDSMDAYFREMLIRHTLFLQETATEMRMAQLVGEDGALIWRSYDRTAIQGDFTFHITAGSSQPRNTEVARQESLAFFQQIAPLIQQQGGNLQPMIEWIAPFYRLPMHLVRQTFSGHKEALAAMAEVLMRSHLGEKIPPAAFVELMTTVVKTGLSPGEMKMVAEKVNAQAQAAAAQGASGGGGGTPPGQPGGLPGTNPSDQLM